MAEEGGLTVETKEKVVILEDDLAVSPHFWRWLRLCHAAYDGRPDFAGCTLQRASLCAKRCPDLHGGPAEASTNFMYPLLGTWGYSPSAQHWVRFTDWAAKFTESKNKPYVKGLTPTHWYKSFEKTGRCPGPKCMWSILHIKYVDTHSDKYTVYVKAPKGESMASNFREPGLHYHGKAEGPDNPLVKSWSDSLAVFPEEPSKLGWDGKVAKP